MTVMGRGYTDCQDGLLSRDTKTRIHPYSHTDTLTHGPVDLGSLGLRTGPGRPLFLNLSHASMNVLLLRLLKCEHKHGHSRTRPRPVCLLHTLDAQHDAAEAMSRAGSVHRCTGCGWTPTGSDTACLRSRVTIRAVVLVKLPPCMKAGPW